MNKANVIKNTASGEYVVRFLGGWTSHWYFHDTKDLQPMLKLLLDENQMFNSLILNPETKSWNREHWCDLLSKSRVLSIEPLDLEYLENWRPYYD